jgi:TDG/mug DNA glycosylase family protein
VTRTSSPSPKQPESPIPDVVGPGLRVLFCGINPGRVSAAAGAHFANPRNDFWRLLHNTGFTPRLLEPPEQFELLKYRIGVTNAASRTTPGSSDLRAADFAGAVERLQGIADELRPSWIGFVGKDAYRGVFRERAAFGVQERQLGATRLFVLPSTSPANAAVPWLERERWFQELAGRSSELPLREAVRALVVDPAGNTLLVRFEWPDKTVWAPPGGGLEPGESERDAIVRELGEEVGLRGCEIGPCVWTRTHWFAEMPGWGGQTERTYLVRTESFEPAPEWTAEQLADEGVAGMRWWSRSELEDATEIFAPRNLPRLLPELLDGGPPPEPVDVGV